MICQICELFKLLYLNRWFRLCVKVGYLHVAYSIGGFETVALLLRRGANVNAQDRNGTTALHLAARNGSAICNVYNVLFIHVTCNC